MTESTPYIVDLAEKVTLSLNKEYGNRSSSKALVLKTLNLQNQELEMSSLYLLPAASISQTA